MTYEEAIESLKYCQHHEDCDGCKLYDDEDCSDIDNALTYKAIFEHHDKYRWHDLRKNPEDLPERAMSITGERTCHESDEVYAYDGSYNFVAEYNHDSGKWTETANYFEIQDNRIIAWREIEPFEEE